jgi:hypothetical protein
VEEMRGRVRAELLTLFLLVCACSAQDSISDLKGFPDLKGFTLSPTEHEIIVERTPLAVRTVHGQIHLKNGSWPSGEYPIALIELRGMDGRIRSTRSKSSGHFEFKRLPDGVYVYKATLNCFKSVIGTLHLCKAFPEKPLVIKIAVGM